MSNTIITLDIKFDKAKWLLLKSDVEIFSCDEITEYFHEHHTDHKINVRKIFGLSKYSNNSKIQFCFAESNNIFIGLIVITKQKGKLPIFTHHKITVDNETTTLYYEKVLLEMSKMVDYQIKLHSDDNIL